MKDQTVHISRVGAAIYRVSWAEPTGTSVALTLNLEDYVVHGAIYFPRWIVDEPEKLLAIKMTISLLWKRSVMPGLSIQPM